MMPVFVRLASYLGTFMSIDCPTAPHTRDGLTIWLVYRARLIKILAEETDYHVLMAVRSQLDVTDGIIDILKYREEKKEQNG
jgi:hypothetical protein